jgi:hypothetical protein
MAEFAMFTAGKPSEAANSGLKAASASRIQAYEIGVRTKGA